MRSGAVQLLDGRGALFSINFAVSGELAALHEQLFHTHFLALADEDILSDLYQTRTQGNWKTWLDEVESAVFPLTCSKSFEEYWSLVVSRPSVDQTEACIWHWQTLHCGESVYYQKLHSEFLRGAQTFQDVKGH